MLTSSITDFGSLGLELIKEESFEPEQGTSPDKKRENPKNVNILNNKIKSVSSELKMEKYKNKKEVQ